MTPEQIKIARKAMGLQGVPTCTLDDECPYALALISIDSYEEWVWDIADTSPAGWALGGVLLMALGAEQASRISIDYTIGTKSFVFSVDFDMDNYSKLSYEYQTLAAACCHVAIENGCWPGGLK